MIKLKKTPIPLYYQLEKVLRKRILSGKLQPDLAVPTEKELCQEFGVSRITVRQALLSLESDNLIRREQGRGTFRSLFAKTITSNSSSMEQWTIFFTWVSRLL